LNHLELIFGKGGKESTQTDGKTINTNKAMATACGGGTKEDMEFVNMNPSFELYSAEYCLGVRVIAAHDNMVAINSAVSVDISGAAVSNAGL
jgi:acyl-CoA hydrolase